MRRRIEVFNHGEGKLWFWRMIENDNLLLTSNIGCETPAGAIDQCRRCFTSFAIADITVLSWEEPNAATGVVQS